ncbi:MAG: phosphate butyryltransferase [Firmicutes bacterium]|nr:phosphate butyryltransferase [Bacillota bacterium]
MVYQTFEQAASALRACRGQRVAAVAAAGHSSVLQAVIQAKRQGVSEAILIGNAAAIKRELAALGGDRGDYDIVNVPDRRQAGEKAVQLAKEGHANYLMKGMMETRDILRPLVKKENGMNTGRIMSHLGFNQLPDYHKLIVNTDGGMVISPSLQEKKGIIENAVAAFHALGYVSPKAAVLAGVEKVNPRMQETVDAAALEQMNRRGEISGCIVRGPLSYDVAMSARLAREKGCSCPDAGDFDILVAPNLAAGNILGKCWSCSAGAIMGGMVVGAKVPVILTSRGASAQEKYYAIVITALVAMGMEKQYE